MKFCAFFVTWSTATISIHCFKVELFLSISWFQRASLWIATRAELLERKFPKKLGRYPANTGQKAPDTPLAIMSISLDNYSP